MARPKRSKQEQIEDLFCDLTILQQVQCLADLAKLHRWCKRLRPDAVVAVSADAEVDRQRELLEGSADDTEYPDMEARCPTRGQ